MASWLSWQSLSQKHMYKNSKMFARIKIIETNNDYNDSTNSNISYSIVWVLNNKTYVYVLHFIRIFWLVSNLCENTYPLLIRIQKCWKTTIYWAHIMDIESVISVESAALHKAYNGFYNMYNRFVKKYMILVVQLLHKILCKIY